MKIFMKTLGALAFIPAFILMMMFGLMALTNMLLATSH